MKKVFLLLMLLMTLSVGAQQNYKNTASTDTINFLSKNITFATPAQEYTFKAGESLQKSVNWQYYSLTSAGLGGIVTIIGSTIKKGEEKKGMSRKSCFIAGGILGVASFVCAMISIEYKMQSGKYLKMSVTESGGVVSYSF